LKQTLKVEVNVIYIEKINSTPNHKQHFTVCFQFLEIQVNDFFAESKVYEVEVSLLYALKHPLTPNSHYPSPESLNAVAMFMRF